MSFLISGAPVDVCRQVSISIDHRTHFDWSDQQTSTLIEAPARLESGSFQIDFIGAFSYFNGGNTEFLYTASVGRYCSIATNVLTGPPEHPTTFLSTHPIFFQHNVSTTHLESQFRMRNAPMLAKSKAVADLYDARFGRIVVGNDVWIGEGVFIRRGVTVGDGAIIGSRAVVVKDVPPFAIVGGTPAEIIRYRFEQPIIERLLEIGWWKYDFRIFEDVDFTNIEQALEMMTANLDSGKVDLNRPPMVQIDRSGHAILCRYDSDLGQIVAGIAA